jgi:signal transduction histidine kinase
MASITPEADDYKERVVRIECENKRLRRSLEELIILNELASSIGGLGSSQSILTQIVRHSITAVGAEEGVITLIDSDAGGRRKTAIRVMDASTEGEPHHLHESILVWMCRHKKPVLMNDPRNDSRFPNVLWDESVRSILCAPLMVKGAMIGVLKIYNKNDPSGFTLEDQRLLGILAAQSAQVVENARISERAQRLQREFSGRLIGSQERERKRIAAELHDSVGQNLLVIKNRAYLAMESCPEHHPSVRELQVISSISLQTIDEVREIAYNLHPHKLDRLGLTKAIQSIVTRMSGSSTVKFSSEVDAIDCLFPKETEVHFFRIVQEGMSNAVRHAKPNSVALHITREPRTVRIMIRDDGCGFDLDELNNDDNRGKGFGLRGMEERARLCDGEFSIYSAPGSGTTLVISIPYEGKCNEE